MGSVPQLRLKMCHYQGGEEGAKGLVTSFFHLLDLEGEKEGLKQEQEGNNPSQARCPHPLQTHLEGRPAPPYPPVSPDPSPNHCSPSGRQRSAQLAQRPASATQRSAADAVVPRGQGNAEPQSKGSGPPPAWKHGSGDVRAQVASGATRGAERVGWGAQQLGARARREIPVTRFKEMEEGERVILWPERTERQLLSEGACRAKRAEAVVGHQGEGACSRHRGVGRGGKGPVRSSLVDTPT